MAYEILTAEKLTDFLYGIESLKAYFEGAELEIEEVGDGNLNFVYIVTSKQDAYRTLVVKQAVPYLRCAGESFPLSRERMTFEIRALQHSEAVAPEFTPKIYHADEEMSLVVMQNLNAHIILRKGLIQKIRYNEFAEHIATYLAQTLFTTSSLCLDSTQKRQMMDRFNANTELCKLTEDFVFTFPYMENETNQIDPLCEAEAKELFADMAFKQMVLKLKYAFLTQSDALLHGDLHTGSIMANERETYVIDPEFAFFGPFGFDTGALLANMINAYVHHTCMGSDAIYRQWLLKTVVSIWNRFEQKFLKLWSDQNESALIVEGYIDDAHLDLYKQQFMKQMFTQTLGFAGCKMARRVFGIAGVEEIRGIEDDTIRKEAQLMALRIGRMLVLEHEHIERIETLVEKIKAVE